MEFRKIFMVDDSWKVYISNLCAYVRHCKTNVVVLTAVFMLLYTHTDPEDYLDGEITVTFGPNSLLTQQCLNVSITNDAISEMCEYFEVLLSTTFPRVIISQSTAMIAINDDDGGE